MNSLDNDVLTSLAMLRRHINILQSPIYRLPSDVFSEVASHLQPETDLIRFTHVSYHLRADLLSYPSLWSCIDSSHEERAQAFFRRSKQAPLHINQIENKHQNLPLLPTHTARLASLEMCDCESQKEFIFSQPMPTLRRLKIVSALHIDGEYDGEIEDFPVWSLTSVTSLILYNVAPTRLHVPHLTRFGFARGDEVTLIDPLLEFLDNCPLLEDLYISINSESSYSRDRLVSLPNLRNYTQRTNRHHHSLGLFNKLSLPPTCSVTIRRVAQPEIVTTADVIPPFRNKDRLVGITRVKLKARGPDIGSWTAGTLEFINTNGVKVCSERTLCGDPVEFIVHDGSDLAHMRCLPDLDPGSVEVLCLEGYSLRDDKGRYVVDDVRNAFGCLRGLTTIILSSTSMEPCLLALDIDPGADGHPRHSPSVNTLVILYSEFCFDWSKTLQILLTVAQRRKAAGSPFKSVSLFLLNDPQSEQILDQLRECIEEFEVTIGDYALGWDVDKYFLAGLDHLQDRRDVWCDQVDNSLQVQRRNPGAW